VKSFDATTAKNRFGQMLAASAEAPVAIERHGRVVAYVVAPKDFEEAPRPLEARLADRLRAAGAKYATLFGSLAQGKARKESDIDVSVSFGKRMSSDLRAAVIGIVADLAGRPVDLVDLETASRLILERALGGTEILCDEVATRQRMIERLLRSEADRRAAATATRAARAGLFG